MLERCFRWKSSPAMDIDAFRLIDGTWLLFAIVKDPSLVDDLRYWETLCSSFDRGKAVGVARALKLEKQSEPLAPVSADGGALAPEAWCREGWLKYRLETREVLNPGLFLDQEVNRQRLAELVQHHYARNQGVFGEQDGLLNLFSFTGSFSIVALGAGVKSTTSVDVSSRYLAWEKQNFEANFGGHDQLEHRLICEDARDYLRRAQKRGSRYRWIVIDPPTFSRGKGKPFKVQEGLLELLELAEGCLTSGGAILASGNDSRWDARDFFGVIERFAKAKKLRVEPGQTAPEFPADHPLKSAWLFSGA